MNSVLSRPAPWQWHALADDLVVGRGHAARRPDGRIFLSVDAWQDTVFHELATAMLADLPRPLYTVVDEADVDLTMQWKDAGLTIGRREWEFVLPTDPIITGLDPVRLPPGVDILPLGTPLVDPLREVDRAIRDERLPAMPAEVLSGPIDPARYVAASAEGRYVGLIRLAPLPRRPRIGLIAVRSGFRGRGVGRAMLASLLATLHRAGTETASVDVHETNTAALALVEGARARRVSSNLELEVI